MDSLEVQVCFGLTPGRRGPKFTKIFVNYSSIIGDDAPQDKSAMTPSSTANPDQPRTGTPLRVLVAGFQHETNTFAPVLADWAAFHRGDSFPAYARGEVNLQRFDGVNIPLGGFLSVAREHGWQLSASVWAGATPSAQVTEDAFERIAGAIVDDVKQALATGLDAIYLDLHGAAVAEHVDDCEGELLLRLRALTGPDMPIVVSLDLHANVTRTMLEQADALTAYRTYPHIDMGDTGRRAAHALLNRLALGRRPAYAWQPLPFLIPLNTQSTWNEPARSLYLAMQRDDADLGCSTEFCMGFPAADFDGCAPVIWSHAADAVTAQTAVQRNLARIAEPAQWRLDIQPAAQTVAWALQQCQQADAQLAAEQAASEVPSTRADSGTALTAPIVIADTQDNPGAGGTAQTTGVLHALLQAQAGRLYPQRVAVGLFFDPELAQRAHQHAVGDSFDASVGQAIPGFDQQLTDPPVQGRFRVVGLSDGACTLRGPMMTGSTVQLGLSAALEIDGILIGVISGKSQLLDREKLRILGIEPEAMRIIVVKSSHHFRADFTPIASQVVSTKAHGPMAADPGDLAWQRLGAGVRTRP